MDTIDFIYSLHSFTLFVCVFLSLLIISLSCLFLVKRFVPLKLRYDENISTAYVGATIGVIYAILAGFIILEVMNNYNRASEITSHEASLVAKIFRNANKMTSPTNAMLHNAMESYTRTVIQTEWPLMIKGKNSDAGEAVLDNLNRQLAAYQPKNTRELLLSQMLFTYLDELYTAREERNDISQTTLTTDLWVLLLIASLLTLMMNTLIGMEFRFHLVLQILVTLMVSATLFLIVALDYPFLGKFSIDPHAFENVLMDMRKS